MSYIFHLLIPPPLLPPPSCVTFIRSAPPPFGPPRNERLKITAFEAVLKAKHAAGSYLRRSALSQEDRWVQYPTFVSATAHYPLARQWMHDTESMLFIVQGVHGKCIGPYAADPGDEEVLPDRGSPALPRRAPHSRVRGCGLHPDFR